MQRLQGPCSQINSLNNKFIQESLAGKWLHFSRVTIVKADQSFFALSLNIFERIAAIFAKLVGKDYLAWKLQMKKAEVCDRSILEKIKRVTTPIVAQKPAPSVENPLVANAPVAQPKNNPVFAIPHDSKLQTFNFNLTKEPNQLTAVMNALKNAPQLEIVVLDGNLRDADPVALKAFSDSLAALPNLKDLTIQCLLNIATVPPLLNGLSRCQRLEQVTVNIHEVLRSHALEAIQHIQSLKSLVVTKSGDADYRTGLICQTQTLNILANMLQNHPALNTLVLREFIFNLPAGDQDCQNSYKAYVNALQNNQRLEKLEVDQTELAATEAQRLSQALAANRALKQLMITNRCVMGPIAIASLLSKLHANQTLQQLRLCVPYNIEQDELNQAAPLLRNWPAGRPPHFQLEFHNGLKPLIDLLPKR